MLVISPFSRGGHIASDVFDHTSQLRFLEERFGVRAPNISAWRRQAAGDLTTTLHMRHKDATVPTLPSAANDLPADVMAEGCTENDIIEVPNNLVAYTVPAHQVMPRQESVRRA
jgi:phospholipase C